jgi:hypothetical protein
MAATNPFSQLTGALKVYIAPYGEAAPDVASAPTGNWVELGSTDGDQKIKHGGKTTQFKDNDHQGVVKVVRHEEDITVKLKVVDLTMENYAYILSSLSKVVGSTSSAGTVQKKLPLKRGANLTEYALLLRGDAISPYGLYPGMYVLPRACQYSEPEVTWGKNQRAALEIEFHVLEDDAQPDDDKLGWLLVQTQ